MSIRRPIITYWKYPSRHQSAILYFAAAAICDGSKYKNLPSDRVYKKEAAIITGHNSGNALSFAFCLSSLLPLAILSSP